MEVASPGNRKKNESMELANPGNQTNEIHKTEIADSLAVGSAVAVRPTVAVAVSAARHDGKRVWTKKKKLEATSRERASERERTNEIASKRNRSKMKSGEVRIRELHLTLIKDDGPTQVFFFFLFLFLLFLSGKGFIYLMNFYFCAIRCNLARYFYNIKVCSHLVLGTLVSSPILTPY
jgi:IS5 family transposase